MDKLLNPILCKNNIYLFVQCCMLKNAEMSETLANKYDLRSIFFYLSVIPFLRKFGYYLQLYKTFILFTSKFYLQNKKPDLDRWLKSTVNSCVRSWLHRLVVGYVSGSGRTKSTCTCVLSINIFVILSI